MSRIIGTAPPRFATAVAKNRGHRSGGDRDYLKKLGIFRGTWLAPLAKLLIGKLLAPRESE